MNIIGPSILFLDSVQDEGNGELKAMEMAGRLGRLRDNNSTAESNRP